MKHGIDLHRLLLPEIEVMTWTRTRARHPEGFLDHQRSKQGAREALMPRVEVAMGSRAWMALDNLALQRSVGFSASARLSFANEVLAVGV